MQSILFAAALMSAAVNGFVLPGETTSTAVCGSTSFTNYTVAHGDTLTTIAQKFNSGICDIASVNDITNPNFIETGAVLSIPTNCVTPDNTTCLPPATEVTETCVAGLPGTYSVVSGDTLSAIAKDFNITLAALEGANTQIANPDVISIGELINIPICPNSQCATVGTYIIVSGDLFVDLATTHHTTIGQIKALNNNVDPESLAIGQQIVLPQNCMNITAVA
ncbi:carbohydrate-binding module family 50 protein [Dothistroma septosporum NZE10]|uniref:Carbohydrate-binding module family 50 protein n=1 Tax=Dothistroma septosporum (strain NZE10 / CBS 128990) TaxID=675120 RepID=N1PI10_DOTSN|nr:carbohydrate-binding module family 50 protein [Dothistroma septosporum NZE10]